MGGMVTLLSVFGAFEPDGFMRIFAAEGASRHALGYNRL